MATFRPANKHFSPQRGVWWAISIYAAILLLLFVVTPLVVTESMDCRCRIKYLYGFLKEWQTGIGALLGFLGLMVIEALRRGAETKERRYIEDKERASLVTLLKEEISLELRIWRKRKAICSSYWRRRKGAQ